MNWALARGGSADPQHIRRTPALSPREVQAMLDQSRFLTARVPTCRSAEFFLARLHRLVLLDWDPDLDGQERHLVRKAVYSTYMDCRALDAGEQAQALITRAPALPGD